MFPTYTVVLVAEAALVSNTTGAVCSSDVLAFRAVFWLAQLHLTALDPSHSPFICVIARSASSLFLKATNPYPRERPVF